MFKSCGMIHDRSQGEETDFNGCILTIGHSGPHEFLAKNGTIWQWETDLSCDCECCKTSFGDFCTLYWPKGYRE